MSGQMSGMEITSSLTRLAASGLVVRGVGLALGLVVPVFLARTLAAEDLGRYQGVLSVCIIVGGLAAAFAERPGARRIARLGVGDSVAVSDETATAHVIVGLVLIPIVLMLTVASFVPAVPETMQVTLRVIALVAPGLAVQSLRQWIALPLHGVAASLGPEQIAQPILFLGLAGLAAYWVGLGPVGALVIYALVCWLVWVIGGWRSGLLRRLRDGLRGLRSRLNLRARFRDARPFVMLSMVGALAGYLTIPIVAASMTTADAGRLAVAIQLTGLIGVPLQVVSLALMPRSVQLHRDGEIAKIGTLVRSACTIGLAAGLALAVLLMLSLDVILQLLGSSFSATAELVPVLALAQLLNVAAGPNGPTLEVMGLERHTARVETVTTVLRLSGVALAAAAGSVLWVAYALAASSLFRNLLLSATLHRRVGILTLPRLPQRRAHA